MTESTVESSTPRPIKRIVSFDFLRGCAIIGVIGFHMMNVTYNYGAVLDNNPPIAYYFIVAILAFMGQMFPLFLIVSAISNTYSIEKKIQKISPDLQKSERNAQYRKIIITQILRGLVLVIFDDISDVLLGKGLIGIMVSDDPHEIKAQMMKTLFNNEMIATIGVSIIITSVLYILLRKAGVKKKAIIVIFMFLAVFVVLITPLVHIAFHYIPTYWNGEPLSFNGHYTGYSNWETQSVGISLLYFVLSPYVASYYPIFPHCSVFFLGVVIAVKILDTGVSKKNLRFLYIWSIVYLFWGILWLILTTDLVLDEGFFPHLDVNSLLIPTANSLVVLGMLLYYAEARGYGNGFAKKTLFFRRFGNMTLSIWCLQWLMVPFLMLLQVIMNLVNGTNVAFRDGPIWNAQLSGYATLGLFMFMLALYSVILWLWEKINFKFSAEWFTVMVLGGKKSRSAKTDMKYMLHHVESIISPEEGNRFYKWYNFILVYLLLLVNMGMGVLLLFL